MTVVSCDAIRRLAQSASSLLSTHNVFRASSPCIISRVIGQRYSFGILTPSCNATAGAGGAVGFTVPASGVALRPERLPCRARENQLPLMSVCRCKNNRNISTQAILNSVLLSSASSSSIVIAACCAVGRAVLLFWLQQK
eukprot:10343-Heterococcus_DN1.PRE.1